MEDIAYLFDLHIAVYKVNVFQQLQPITAYHVTVSIDKITFILSPCLG